MYNTASIDKKQTKMEWSAARTLLFERNKETFKKLGIIEPYFTIKMAYFNKRTQKFRGQQVINMFESEVSKGDDIYVEITDGNNIPVNETPTVYRLPFTADYQTEYEVDIDPIKGPKSLKYLVPLSKLELVDVWTPAVKGDDFEVPQKEEEGDYKDCHYSELTARDRACIDLRVPESNKEWLNDLIRKANKK
jgi:hypothetical protein